MGLSRRLAMIIKSKTSTLLDRAEDPRQTLDYSYEKQLQLLQQVRRGVADVATNRKRLELQAEQLTASGQKLRSQATQAVSMGREDLAREALTRGAAIQQQLTDLGEQHATLRAQERQLTASSQRLQAKVDAFRTRKETLKATYTAADAQTKLSEAFSGISEEMGDVGLAMQRAEDKTARLQARAGALDELLASGALEDVSGTAGDDLQQELDQVSTRSDVELQLAQIKHELGSGGSSSALESGHSERSAATATTATGTDERTERATPAEGEEQR